MKAIICEMCSGHDFIKDGDYYVCQSCGTKYTIESAKKLMMEIEGKVDVSGSTIQDDNTKQTEKLRKAAEYAQSI